MSAIILKDRITKNYSDEEFLQFCEENRDLRIERNNKLEVIIMSPANSLTGKINAEITRQLSNWNASHQRGEVFDSSAGFTLPDRSVLSPDAAWMPVAMWNSLTEQEQWSFAPVCPLFIIEVRSKTDTLYDLHKKMNVWIQSGAQAGWLIDPLNRVTTIYRKDAPEEIIEGFDRKISGNGPVEGFVLDLSFIVKIKR